MSTSRSYFYGSDQRLRAGKTSVVINAGAREQILDQMNEQLLFDMAQDIADRANRASSWGGYEVWLGGTVSRVYGINAGSSERARRLLSIAGQM